MKIKNIERLINAPLNSKKMPNQLLSCLLNLSNLTSSEKTKRKTLTYSKLLFQTVVSPIF